MITKLLAMCCGTLLVFACSRAPEPEPPTPDPAATSDIVEAIRDYSNPRDIPARFQHLVDWQAGTGPVVLLIANGGRRACAITPDDATSAIIGQRYRCRWSSAR